MEKIEKNTLLFFASIANESVAKFYDLATIVDKKNFACQCISSSLGDELDAVLIEFYIWGENNDEPISASTLRGKDVRFISYRVKEKMAIVAVKVPFLKIAEKNTHELNVIFAELIQLAVREVGIKLEKKIRSVNFQALQESVKNRCDTFLRNECSGNTEHSPCK